MLKILIGYAIFVGLMYYMTMGYDVNNKVWYPLLGRIGKGRLCFFVVIGYLCTDIFVRVIFDNSYIFHVLHNIILAVFAHFLLYAFISGKDGKFKI